MNSDNFSDSLVQYINKLERAKIDSKQKLSRYRQLYKFLIAHLTDKSNIQFTSLFSRLSYFISFFQITGIDIYLLHAFRKQYSNDDEVDIEKEVILGQCCIDIISTKGLRVKSFYNTHRQSVYEKYFKGNNEDFIKYIPIVTVHINGIDIDNKYLFVQLNNEPFEHVTVGYNKAERNEDFSSLFNALNDQDAFPVTCNLINVEIDNRGMYHPSAYVFEPDYLYDVTTISECFGPFDSHELGFFIKKFVGHRSSPALLVGNISNYFLDQLIYNPDLTFDNVVKRVFQLDPLSIALLQDIEVREMIENLKLHFTNLKRVVNNDFSRVNIDKAESYIEPSFYSAKYGIQGRLDLFTIREKSASIVELKSGKPFRINAYGLNNNHYHQTLLYDMLIESVMGNQLKRNNFILYSKEPSNNLRFAPSIKSQQRETIKFRNRLFLLEHQLRSSDNFLEIIIALEKKHNKSIKGFQRKDVDQIIKSFESLDSIELAYCQELIWFIFNEQRLSKLGDDTKERLSGLASLWRDDLELKIEQFNVINHLTIEVNKSVNDDPVIILHKTEKTAELNNFRVGDLAILYGYQRGKESVLKDQVFKCTILLNTKMHVHIRLRSRQENPNIFKSHRYWNLEHDVLENGFTAMTRSVLEFAQASDKYRKLIMGCIDPEASKYSSYHSIKGMTQEQNKLFNEIISSEDYYLLWGPPGTGKTSILLKNLSKHYYHETDNRILLLAYTNRAVDEICHALVDIDLDDKFIRIGSRYSTGVEYQQHLLDVHIGQCANRREVRDKLMATKIYVGTVASIIGKSALFGLLKFDLAIIDEASQILDASLIGLLSRVKKFVLIGDHLQLPAVVLQQKEKTRIKNEQLQRQGIINLSDSLFERMYLHALKRKWHHAIGQLSYQGRMHDDLMAFPNRHFYNNTLKAVPSISRLSAGMSNSLRHPIGENRFVFIPSKVDIESASIKVNEHEAHQVIYVIKELLQIYKSKNLEIQKNSIGIITPFRAQIARIVKNMEGQCPELCDLITVDTVERYQGGARDIIILSACLNFAFQIDGIVSLSEDGVDRKLNVAFTRAREQFILIGNENILRQNDVYSDLINRSATYKI